MNRNHLNWTLFFLSPLLFLSTAIADHGVLMVAKGDIKIQSAKDKSIRAGKMGDKVYAKDIIIAGKDSRAKIVMVDKNVLNISPDSKIEIQTYVFKPEENKKNVVLNVLYGKVRSSVEQKYDGEKNKFHVKTPSAVAGVRGTDFLVSFNQSNQSSQIVTFSGQVQVGSGVGASGQIQNPVFVMPGQTTTASPNTPPAAPVALSKNEMATLNKETAADTGSAKPTPQEQKTSESKEPKKEDAPKEPKKEDAPKEQKPDGDKPKSSEKTNSDGSKQGDASGTKTGDAPKERAPASAESQTAPTGGTAPSGDKAPGPGTGATTMAPGAADMRNETPTGVPMTGGTAGRGLASEINLPPPDTACAACKPMIVLPPVSNDILQGTGKTKVNITIQN